MPPSTALDGVQAASQPAGLAQSLADDAALNSSIRRIRELMREVPGMDLPADLFQGALGCTGPPTLVEELWRMSAPAAPARL